MAIDVLTEQLFSLTEAAELMPARRKGRRLHVSCLYRWSTAGCRGVILETVSVGGTRCTSREAVVRFIEAVTAVRRGKQPAALPRSPSRHQAAAAKAKQELAKLGI